MPGSSPGYELGRPGGTKRNPEFFPPRRTEFCSASSRPIAILGLIIAERFALVTTYYLPRKIISYLKRIDLDYIRSGDTLRHEIISSARFEVVEAVSYDNWNGGVTGHNVILYLEEPILAKVSLSNQSEIARTISEDLNKCAIAVPNEFIQDVSLEVADENDSDFQRARPTSARVELDASSLAIWKPGHVRLFISHRDIHKRTANELAEALDGLGICCFIAHDTIQATKEWRKEILNGLETMEAMLIFLTNDLHDSPYTNQEIGFALGRHVPIISLKLESKDPQGFIAHEQALRGTLENPANSAAKIYKLIGERLGSKERMQTALISSFISSPGFSETRDRFDKMKVAVERLSKEEVELIIEGFRNNSQLHNAIYITNKYCRLTNFLQKTTGKNFEIVDRTSARQRRRQRTRFPSEDSPPNPPSSTPQ